MTGPRGQSFRSTIDLRVVGLRQPWGRGFAFPKSPVGAALVSDVIQFEIAMGNDEEGFFGRECPNEECLGYFKIELGTGLRGEDLPCHCPYCGHVGSRDTFWTQDQVEYARSLAMREVQRYVGDMLKSAFPPSRPKCGDLFSLTFEYKPGRPLPIYRYQEKQLEAALICSDCGLRYAVYGVFAFCPDCGSHNSLQILESNLHLAAKELVLAESVDAQLSALLVQDALENGVSAFDAFGRALAVANADLANDPDSARVISCQNVDRLSLKLRELFGFDLASGFGQEEWHHLVVAFQKRHLLAHKAGVTDTTYLQATGDRSAVLGRMVSVPPEEVAAALPLVGKLGMRLHSQFKTLRERII